MKRILTVLLTLTLLAGLAVSAWGATYHINDLQDGDILFPGDIIDGIDRNALVRVTDAWDTDAPQYTWLGGNGEDDLYYTSLTFGREPVLHTAQELYSDPNVRFAVQGTDMVFFNYYIYCFDLNGSNVPSFFAAYDPIYGTLHEFDENGEAFWKWWRNAARLVRTEKTVTLNVPEEIDNTIVPTFLFTAIKEANANVTLNIGGETYTLNANNLPDYYSWVSEVSVEILD